MLETLRNVRSEFRAVRERELHEKRLRLRAEEKKAVTLLTTAVKDELNSLREQQKNAAHAALSRLRAREAERAADISLMEERFERETVVMLRNYFKENPSLNNRVINLRNIIDGGDRLSAEGAMCDLYMDALHTLTNLLTTLPHQDVARYEAHRRTGVPHVQRAREVIDYVLLRGSLRFGLSPSPLDFKRIHNELRDVRFGVVNVINLISFDVSKTQLK